jgi:hypothetical protein
MGLFKPLSDRFALGKCVKSKNEAAVHAFETSGPAVRPKLGFRYEIFASLRSTKAAALSRMTMVQRMKWVSRSS